MGQVVGDGIITGLGAPDSFIVTWGVAEMAGAAVGIGEALPVAPLESPVICAWVTVHVTVTFFAVVTSAATTEVTLNPC